MRLILAVLLLVGSTGVSFAATLEVRTQPGVDVYWEGILLATTDTQGLLVVEDVPEGPFELELRKSGHETLVTEVVIGGGVTQWSRQLMPLASSELEPIETESTEAEPPSPSAADAPASVPGFRVSPLGWLAVIAGLCLVVFAVLRGRRRAPVEEPPSEPRRPERVRRTAEPRQEAGGTFLNDLRQRERAMDDLVEVQGGEVFDEPSDADVVDVAWKEVE